MASRALSLSHFTEFQSVKNNFNYILTILSSFGVASAFPSLRGRCSQLRASPRSPGWCLSPRSAVTGEPPRAPGGPP